MSVSIKMACEWMSAVFPYRRPVLSFQVDVVGEGEVVAGEAFLAVIGGVVDVFAVEELQDLTAGVDLAGSAALRMRMGVSADEPSPPPLFSMMEAGSGR